MFYAAQQILDFARSRLCLGVIQWDSAAESELRRSQPLARLLDAAQNTDGFSHQPGKSENAIRLRRVQPALGLAPLQCRLGNGEQRRQLPVVDIEACLEMIQFANGEPGLNGFDDPGVRQTPG